MSEITNNTDAQDITAIYNPMVEAEAPREIEEQVEETIAPVAEETAEKAEEVAQEVIAKVVAEEKKEEAKTQEVKAAPAQTAPVQAAPAKKAFPAVKLVKLSRDDLKKKDAKLVEKHVPSRVKDIKWDAARSVVVIFKSKQERAYQIGHGAAPALIESKKHADIVNYLKNM